MLTGAYSYDNGARLTGIAYTSNGGADTIDTLGWGYDPANNVTSFTSIDGTASYAYDPTNQLTSATYTTAQGGHQPANESYSFDLNGNRNSAGYTTGSRQPDDERRHVQLPARRRRQHHQSARGSPTPMRPITRRAYTWDYRNRLTDVEYYDNNSVLTKHVHYVYDVFDNLIGEQDDDTGSGSYDNQQFYVVGAVSQDAGSGTAAGGSHAAAAAVRRQRGPYRKIPGRS